jgi:hypothetical protein
MCQANILDIDTGGLESNPFSPSEMSSPQYGVGVFLIHELFGDPFRTVAVNPAWLSWDEGAIVSLTQEMHEAAEFRRMPALQSRGSKSAFAGSTMIDGNRRRDRGRPWPQTP